MDRKIICNKIRTPDGTILESKSVHDYVTHIDNNGLEYSTDGGTEYLHRIVHEKAPYEDLTVYLDDPIELIRDNVVWGTYGKQGNEKLQYKKVKDMSNKHIERILYIYADRLGETTKEIFNRELDYRTKNIIIIED